MSPILGIIASSQQPQFLSSFESIATVTVGSGGSSSITFSSIPSTYKHLQIRGISFYGSWMGMRFNGVSTVNTYNSHYIRGNGSVADSGTSGADDSIRFGIGGDTTNPTGVVVDILDYTSTNKYKTIRSLSGGDNNGSGSVVLGSGFFLGNTNAITSITIVNYFGGNFPQYSSFALYGCK